MNNNDINMNVKIGLVTKVASNLYELRDLLDLKFRTPIYGEDGMDHDEYMETLRRYNECEKAIHEL